MTGTAVTLAAITLGAAIVNGAVGYGFSSLTVPLALMFLTNRTLNPAIVPIELVLNAHLLWVNRSALARASRRVLPVAIGLAPGVVIGTMVVARVTPDIVRLGSLALLLPVILAQAAGFRRPVRRERGVGLAFGSVLGLLYAVTTISGPPLAMALNNQGLSKEEFRAALGLVRLAESATTVAAYAAAGLFTAGGAALVPAILPSVAIGVPIGALLVRRVRADVFRRVCTSVDAWVVSFGLATVIRQLHVVDSLAAYAIVAVVMLVDASFLYRYFAGAGRPGVTYAA